MVVRILNGMLLNARLIWVAKKHRVPLLGAFEIVRYDAIAHRGHRDERQVQCQFKDLAPLTHRSDLDGKDRSMERPADRQVQNTADCTEAALEKLANTKIRATQPKYAPDTKGKMAFFRYTPGQQDPSQRIMKMPEVVEDPLEPPRFKHKKIPRGPPSPPAPVLRSLPWKATARAQKERMILPCISDWKNNKGFATPLATRSWVTG